MTPTDLAAQGRLRDEHELAFLRDRLTASLRLPDLAPRQRAWLEGMVNGLRWVQERPRPPGNVDGTRCIVASNYRKLDDSTTKCFLGGQLAVLAWYRHDEAPPPGTPTGLPVARVLEGAQLRSTVELVTGG